MVLLVEDSENDTLDDTVDVALTDSVVKAVLDTGLVILAEWPRRWVKLLSRVILAIHFYKRTATTLYHIVCVGEVN